MLLTSIGARLGKLRKRCLMSEIQVQQLKFKFLFKTKSVRVLNKWRLLIDLIIHKD